MKQITPFAVWHNGANVDAEYFAMKSIDDNLDFQSLDLPSYHRERLPLPLQRVTASLR
jgi:hypothetical protein